MVWNTLSKLVRWGTLQFIEWQVKSSKSSEAFRDLKIQIYRKKVVEKKRELGGKGKGKEKFLNLRGRKKKKKALMTHFRGATREPGFFLPA